MTTDLETRLERAIDALPRPGEAARARARDGALAALPRVRRSPPRFRAYIAAGVTAFVVAAVAALALVAPWEGRAPFAPERALAAIGDQPVLHAVTESERPWATIVDLRTGEERPQTEATEFWFDAKRGLLRARTTVDGRLVSELLQTRERGDSTQGPVLGPPFDPRLDPALAGFATRYREALESGQAIIVGETSVGGRDALRLEISILSAAPRDVREQVDIDADSYRPLRFRFLVEGGTAGWRRVVSIATLPRLDGQFRTPPLGPPRPQAQTGSDERELTPAEAARALDRPALWPGPVVSGVELTAIEVMKLTTLWTDGRETEGRALRLEYGGGKLDRASRWLEIRQGTSREERPRIGPDEPEVGPGQVQLFGLGDADGSAVDWWVAYLDRNGVFLTLESSERELLLEAARSLVPIVEG